MPLQAVLDAAIKEIGYKEGANNDNKFAKVAGHANNQAWCATFIRACFIKGKEEKAIPDTAYCPYIESWARQHNRIVPLVEARKGDLALLDFSRSGKAEHVVMLTANYNPASPNLLRTVGGNTSSSTSSGSQANGDGVAAKNYSASLVRVIVRPNWSK
jgi:hypothetical protein